MNCGGGKWGSVVISFRVRIRVGIRVRLWKEMALMAGGKKAWKMEHGRLW